MAHHAGGLPTVQGDETWGGGGEGGESPTGEGAVVTGHSEGVVSTQQRGGGGVRGGEGDSHTWPACTQQHHSIHLLSIPNSAAYIIRGNFQGHPLNQSQPECVI